jgi:hypothetical protein
LAFSIFAYKTISILEVAELQELVKVQEEKQQRTKTL